MGKGTRANSVSYPLNPLCNRVHHRKTLSRHKFGPLAVVDDERRGAFSTGKVERAALLAIKAGDLTGV